MLFQSVPLQERINFARHLHLVVKSGLSIIDGLRIVAEQTSSKTLVKIIQSLVKGVNKGRFLSEGLRNHEEVFGNFFISIVEIGERSGNLTQSLLYLAEELDKKRELQGKVKAALIYPVIIFIATVGITLFLIFFVLPKILPVLSDLQVELPVTTRFLIALVDFSTAYWFVILPFLVFFPIAWKLFLHINIIRLLYDRLLLFVPVISRIVVGVTMVDFSRSLGLLMKSGVPIVDALEVSSRSLRNSTYRREIIQAREYVRKGE